MRVMEGAMREMERLLAGARRERERTKPVKACFEVEYLLVLSVGFGERQGGTDMGRVEEPT